MSDGVEDDDHTDHIVLLKIKRRLVDLMADGDQSGPAAAVIREILRDDLRGY